MKILCVCSGGNVRSVSLAYLLKYLYSADALSCGVKANTPETISMLCDWADTVIILEYNLIQKLPQKYHKKVQVLDVGKDVWRQALHPGLMHKLYKGLHNLDIKR